MSAFAADWMAPGDVYSQGMQGGPRHWRSRLRARPLLGTLVSIRIDEIDGDVDEAFSEAFDTIETIHRAMSFHTRDSELDRLNRDASHRAVTVGRHTWRVLCASLALARISAGRFDPTIAGRLVRDGFLPAHPDRVASDEADWQDVILTPGRQVLFRKPLLLDFGGIAKGYAVDQAVAALRRAGVRAAMVNAGGDLRIFGETEQIIQVRDPASPMRSRPLLALRSGAVATSGGYFSERDGRTPLIDPRTSAALARHGSVSVCAPRAIWADALTKLVLVDATFAGDMLRRFHASAMILDADGHCRQVGA